MRRRSWSAGLGGWGAGGQRVSRSSNAEHRGQLVERTARLSLQLGHIRSNPKVARFYILTKRTGDPSHFQQGMLPGA